MPTTVANGFLPDLDALDEATLARTVAMYVLSPANPQGAVATPATSRSCTTSRCATVSSCYQDECYSEIYTQAAPGSMLASAGPDYANVVAVPVAV